MQHILKHRVMAFLAVLFLSMGVPSAMSAIDVDSSFDGTLIITYADGNVALVEPGEPLPTIPSGATIEVFDGSFSLTTGAGDSVSVSCGGSSQSVGGGGSASVSCGQTDPAITVNGVRYPVTPVENPEPEAPPTAAAGDTSFRGPQDSQPDTRDIDNSPFS